MPMDLHGNYVYPGLSYPSYTLPLPNVTAQSSAAYTNPHMLYYPATNPVYTGLQPVYPPSDLYSSPTFLSHLKAIADNILASDAKTRKRGAKPKLATKPTTPPVRRPVTDTLDELRSSAYYRNMQVAASTTMPVEYPNTPIQDLSVPRTPTEFVTISSDSDEEFIDVEDIAENRDDITPSAPTPIADSPCFGEVLTQKTGGDLPQFVATFNEDPRYTVTSASTNLMLMESANFATTPPLSDTDTEKSNEAYPRSSFEALTKRNESSAHLFGQGLQKTLDDTGKKWGTERRPSPRIDQSVYINGTSSVEWENTIFPPRPPSAPLRLQTPSEVYDAGLEQRKKRPVRPRSEPAVLYDETWIHQRKPKQMRTESLASTLESKTGGPAKRTVLAHAIESLVDCGVKRPSRSQEHSCSVAGSQFSTGTPSSYAKQKSLAPELPQQGPVSGATAPSARSQFSTGTPSSYAKQKSVAPELPQPRAVIGANAPRARSQFSTGKQKSLGPELPQPRAVIGATAPSSRSSFSTGTPSSYAKQKSLAPELPQQGAVSGATAPSARSQFSTGTPPSAAKRKSLASELPQPRAVIGATAPSARSQFSTGTPPSYAKQKSLAPELPQPRAVSGASASESLHFGPSPPAESFNASPSCANATQPTSEVPQPSPGTGTTAPPNAWPWFGLPSISDLMSFTPQVAPYATGQPQYGTGTTPSSAPHEAPQPTATSTSAWPYTGLHFAPAYEEVYAKPAEAQCATGGCPSFPSGTSMVYGDPQAKPGPGAETRAWSLQWNGHQSVSLHPKTSTSPSYSGNTSPVNLSPHTGGKKWGANELRSRTSRTQLTPPMTSAREPPNHMAITKNFQVSTPERVKTAGLPSNGFPRANQKNPLLDNSKRPNSKRKFDSPKIEVSPKYQRARKPGRLSAQPPKQRRMFPDEAQNTYHRQAPIFTSIGARGTLVRRDFYDIIVWDDYVQCTKLLMQFIFNFRSLATLTLDGPDRLDPNIVHDIATHVSVKCGIPVEQVHHTMRHVCTVAKQCFEESNRS